MPKNLGEGGILKTQSKDKNQNKLMIKVTQEPDLRPKIRPDGQRWNMGGKVINVGSDTFGNPIFQKGLQN